MLQKKIYRVLKLKKGLFFLNISEIDCRTESNICSGRHFVFYGPNFKN